MKKKEIKGIYKVSGSRGYIAIFLLPKAKYNDIISIEVGSHGGVHSMNMQPWEAREIIKGLKMALKSIPKICEKMCDEYIISGAKQCKHI